MTPNYTCDDCAFTAPNTAEGDAAAQAHADANPTHTLRLKAETSE